MAARAAGGSLFDLFETATFDNVWYWIITVIAWSMTCHWTLGVPYDVIVQADQRGGEAASHVDAVGAAGIARITAAVRSAGLFIAALAGFIGASLVTIGFWSGVEIAQGAAVLILPLMLVAALNVRLAFRLERMQARGATLRRALNRRRFWNQVIGLASIVVAAGVGALHIVSRDLAAIP
ncbi:MAG: hypothetical protein D6754_11395 [Alphaproteobacteria bacterium]|nr:MAG: hypothetical protein D6754_11395 [Alphaproteobacteria bacterium]